MQRFPWLYLSSPQCPDAPGRLNLPGRNLPPLGLRSAVSLPGYVLRDGEATATALVLEDSLLTPVCPSSLARRRPAPAASGIVTTDAWNLCRFHSNPQLLRKSEI
ncbi:hypothetical protein UC8_39540 [Roseimaritima ulvae]|uniref:Uncharacterized protein n=1 Tax=Roseimaritima ulvae TaxID=980254 RepID=A0A5B9QXV6_9BACT|nr:hypothetical protein UC8_39540 [Roseimaritima ulvae]